MKTRKVHWLIIAITSIGCLGAAEKGHDKHPYGLRPLKRKDVEELEKGAKKVIRVKQNNLAKQRARFSDMGEELMPEGGIEIEDEYVLIDGSSEDAMLMFRAEESALPERVNNALLPSFPPIGSQGSIGSCVAWGSTYYQATHEIGLLNGYDNRYSYEHVLSPKWTYNILNGGVNKGLTIYDASNLLAANGAPSMVQFPYDSSFTSWTVNKDHWMSAIKNRMAPYVLIPGIGGASQNLTAIKTALANGHVLTFSTFITSWNMIRIKSDPENINNKYTGEYAVNYMAGRDGAHFMTIVGYDDTLWIDVNGNGRVDQGERGAFLVANSFGQLWGNRGFMWVSYDAFLSTSAVAGGPKSRRVAITDPLWSCISAVPLAKNYTPSLVAEFSITTARRQELWVVGGTSLTNSRVPTITSLTNYALDMNGGPLTFQGTTSTVPTTGNFVMDFTDLISLSSTVPIRYHLNVMDTRVGNPSTVNSYILKDLVHNREIAAGSTPITVDGTNVARLYVDYNFNEGNVPQIDTPLVTILSPSSGTLISENITLTAEVTSASLITSVVLSIDGISIGDLTFADGIYTISVNTEKLSNGSHTFMLTTTNSAGNVDKTSRVLNVNNIGVPSLTLKSPNRGSTVSGYVLLSLAATSPTPITTVSVAVDSIFVGNMNLKGGTCDFLLDTMSYGNGSHTLSFIATNTAGKQCFLDTTVLISNTETPAVTIITPGSDAVVAGIIPLTVRAASTIGIRDVLLEIDSRPAGTLILSDNSYGTIIDTTQLTNGDHMLEVTATNSAGNYVQTTWFITVANSDIPAIAILSPANGFVVNGSVPFSVRAGSGRGVAGVSLIVDSLPWANLSLSGDNYGITVDTTTLANGSHTFQFVVTDTAGKTASAVTVLTVNNIDTPVIEVLTPTEGATIQGTLPLSIQVNGTTPIANVQCIIDSTSVGNLVLVNGKYGTTIDTTQLSDGNHILKFLATNTGGITATATRTITIVNVDSPVVTIHTPISGATLSGPVFLSVEVTGATPIAQVALTVDSTPIGLLSPSMGGYGISLDTTKFSNGSHVLKFAATNSGGKIGIATVMVNIANIDSPMVTIQGIAEGANMSGIKSLFVQASGISPITQVALTVDSTPMGLLTQTLDGYTISLDTTKFSNGSHVLKFAATNSGGKMTVASVTINVTNVDSPVVKIQGIVEGTTLSKTRILSVSATGISPITQVALTVDSTPMGLMKLTQGIYTISLDTSKFSNGSHILKFAATNSGGKMTVAAVSVNVSN